MMLSLIWTSIAFLCLYQSTAYSFLVKTSARGRVISLHAQERQVPLHNPKIKAVRAFSGAKAIHNRIKRNSFDREALTAAAESSTQSWRFFNVDVSLSEDPGKDMIHVHDALRTAFTKLFRNKNQTNELFMSNMSVVRKSFDSRIKKYPQPKFVYTIDVELPSSLVRQLRLTHVDGKSERILQTDKLPVRPSANDHQKEKEKVIIVGAGPSGLFAAVELVKAGFAPIIIDRGQPVDIRGRDIGALFNRKILKKDSNLCYGEGGAGTWSDGKLTTRIGKNSDSVRSVLSELVKHGAPERILVDGKPHLGTDKLVRILQHLRHDLTAQGAMFLFKTTVVDILPSSSSSEPSIEGVILANGSSLYSKLTILAVGHSSRAMYERLASRGVKLAAKPIAVGFRIEHPQSLINQIQYGSFSDLCLRGKGKIPVADYRLAANISNSEDNNRACYSFCMCPGGQIGKLMTKACSSTL
jgi:uncharacterized FAD-dependent dehydrogenase